MSATIDAPAPTRIEEEQRVLLPGISWERFEQLSACFEEIKSVRLTYFDGSLEIMSPVGEEHETYKKNISYLLEAYLDLKGIRFYGRGGFTLRQSGLAAGEPDESYCIDTNKEVPDLVIEIVVTSGALSKMPLYKVKEVKEVWIWRNGNLGVYTLEQNAYCKSRNSKLLPDLDIDLLAEHARMPDQYDAIRAFRKAIM